MSDVPDPASAGTGDDAAGPRRPVAVSAADGVPAASRAYQRVGQRVGTYAGLWAGSYIGLHAGLVYVATHVGTHAGCHGGRKGVLTARLMGPIRTKRLVWRGQGSASRSLGERSA